jgi:hypothetical protein
MTDEKMTPSEEESVPDTQDAPQKKPKLRERLRRAWRMEDATGRRRLVQRTLIIVAVITVFVIVPGYVALQPSFVQRYTNLSPEYETWHKSVHANVACQRCHVPPGTVPQTVYAARMLGEFYLSLVQPRRQPQLFNKPVNTACQSCHIDLRTVSPSGDLNIPHKFHVDMLKMQCIQCHRYLVHQPNPAGTHTPWMATCLQCHDGKTAKNGCQTCHTNKATPVSHRAPDWTIIHPTMQSKINCKQCHAWTADWCRECHTHRPADHTADWRTKHGAQVAKHRNCEACHLPAFCIGCHGAVPQTNFNPALKFVQ